MDTSEIGKVKTVLGTRTASDDLINVYLEDMSVVALSVLGEVTDMSKVIVRECVVELINRQGDEGISSSNGGSQTYTYEDAIENLKRRLKAHRKGAKKL